MKFKSLKKIEEGKFINRYNLTYETVDKKEKIYEMISYDKNIETFDDLRSEKTNSVIIVAKNETNDRILLNKEFRLAIGRWVYNFPAGLIDEGEDYETAAKRELKEETGLELYKITDVLKNSFSAVGFSNELGKVVFGNAKGTFSESTSTFEEIECNWYSKEEIKELLKTEYFSARAQMYCYTWVNS